MSSERFKMRTMEDELWVLRDTVVELQLIASFIESKDSGDFTDTEAKYIYPGVGRLLERMSVRILQVVARISDQDAAAGVRN